MNFALQIHVSKYDILSWEEFRRNTDSIYNDIAHGSIRPPEPECKNERVVPVWADDSIPLIVTSNSRPCESLIP